METRLIGIELAIAAVILFQSFPRKGMETRQVFILPIGKILFQSFPRKGMETFPPPKLLSPGRLSFSIISPQGDGNSLHRRVGTALRHQSHRLFQSFPRKGMETLRTSCKCRGFPGENFFNHFPARGWKRDFLDAR